MDEAAFGHLTTGLNNFAELLIQAGVALHGFHDIVQGFSKALMAPIKAVEGLVGVIKDNKNIFDPIINAVGHSATAISASLPYIGVVFAAIGVVANAILLFASALGQAVSGLIQLGLAALPGGLKVFGDVMEYVTSVVGSFLGPAITVFLAGLLTLADVLLGPMKEATDTFIDEAMNGTITVMATFVNVAKKVVELLPEIVKWGVQVGGALVQAANAFINSIFGVGINLYNALQPFINAIKRLALFMIHFLPSVVKPLSPTGEGPFDAAKKAIAAIPGIPEKFKNAFTMVAGKSTEQRIKENLPAVISAMELELGKKGNIGFSSIADVQKQVQMNAIQNDIQARTLQVQIDILNTLKEKLAKPNMVPPTKK